MKKRKLIRLAVATVATVVASLMAALLAAFVVAGISAKHTAGRKVQVQPPARAANAPPGAAATAEAQRGSDPHAQVAAARDDAERGGESRFAGDFGDQEGREAPAAGTAAANGAKTSEAKASEAEASQAKARETKASDTKALEDLVRLRRSQLEDQKRAGEAARAGKLIIAWMQWRKNDEGTALLLDLTLENLSPRSLPNVRIDCDLFDDAGTRLSGNDNVAVVPRVDQAPFLTQIHDLDMGGVDARTADVKCRVAE